MSDETREQRRTRWLQETIPLYGIIDLEVDTLDDKARCSVPLSTANTNHVGIMHAGVLFSLAEATAGVAISVHRDLARHAVIAKEVTIKYLRPAITRISAMSVVSPQQADQIRSGMASDSKFSFDVPVELFDAADAAVASGTCTFVLRHLPSSGSASS